MELRQLQFVVAAAEELDFARAAERLGVDPAELVAQVAELEIELSAPLIDRSGESIALTGAGARFVDEARAVLVAARRARESVVLDGRPRLYIGTSDGLGDRLTALADGLSGGTPSTLAEFVAGSTHARLEGVRSGRLDAAFVRGTVALPDLEVVPVWSDDVVAVLPAEHPLSEQASVSVFDLLDLPLCLVARALNPPLVDLIEQTCRRLGFEPELARPTGRRDESLAAVGSGASCWTLDYAAQAGVAPDARLAVRPFDPPLQLPTALAMTPGAGAQSLAPLLAACARLAAD